MSLRQDYDDAALEVKIATADVVRWVHTLDCERRDHRSGFTIADSRVELDAASRRLTACQFKLDLVLRAMTEANEVAP